MMIAYLVMAKTMTIAVREKMLDRRSFFHKVIRT